LYVVIMLACTLLSMIAEERGAAHDPVTSKYDYNNDVLPLLRDHCGRCHVEGGPAPMSLMAYQDAVPWAQAIRDELTSGRMPPWPVDPTSPAVRGGYSISARDLDTIVEWASGGTPEGGFQTTQPATTFSTRWKFGPPDLTISMDIEQTVVENTIEEIREFSLPTNLAETKWIKAADLMPGTASLVRDAVIRIENGPVLALWQPGGGTAAAPPGAAFRLAPDSKIHLQIHYRKHYNRESEVASDRSTIGLYFTDPPASGRGLESFAISPSDAAGDFSGASTFAGTLPRAARIVALRPMLDRAYETLNVDAIIPSGSRVPLLRLYGPRPQWFQRYWLQEPVELVSGARIEVSVIPLSDYSDEPRMPRRFPLQLALDYVPL
jgi:hypothetical protein